MRRTGRTTLQVTELPGERPVDDAQLTGPVAALGGALDHVVEQVEILSAPAELRT